MKVTDEQLRRYMHSHNKELTTLFLKEFYLTEEEFELKIKSLMYIRSVITEEVCIE